MSVTTANRDINSLTPLAQEACRLFLDECKKQGVNVFITEAFRSQERQNYLYSLGRTKSGAIVTNTLNSIHTQRNAWDIAVSPPNALYDAKILAKAGKIAGELGVEWGGNWTSFKDTPHFQINTNWKNPKKHTPQPTKVKFNLRGKNTTLDGFIEDGKTFVIIRPMLEQLGYSVGWDNNEKAVTVNGKITKIDSKIVDGRTYGIVRPLLERLGHKVDFDNSTKTIIVK